MYEEKQESEGKLASIQAARADALTNAAFNANWGSLIGQAGIDPQVGVGISTNAASAMGVSCRPVRCAKSVHCRHHRAATGGI
jgi:hypothetical protein